MQKAITARDEQSSIIMVGKRKREEEEEMTTKLCFCVESVYHYRWYDVDLTTTGGGAPSLLCEIPSGDVPSGFNCVALDSKIYLIGGTEVDTDPILECTIPSSAVHVIETSRNCGMKDGIRMIGGKAWPVAGNVDGKIYVLGNSYPHLPAEPWAEVFDPVGKRWDGLPYPSDDVIFASTRCKSHHVVDENRKKILVLYLYPLRRLGMCSFDVTTKSWEYRLNMPVTEQFASPGRHVIVDDVLYMFSKKHLYAYRLASSQPPTKVDGLEEATKSRYMRDSDSDSDSDDNYSPHPAFLFYLGNPNKQLCLVWYEGGLTSGLHITCVKFRVQEMIDGSLHAVVDGIDPYLVDDGYAIKDCLTIKHAPLAAAANLDSILLPAVPQPLARTNFASQALATTSQVLGLKEATRHARRIYVGGFPLSQSAEEIEKLFNSHVKGSGNSGGVVDVYFNPEKNFAIVELSSEEEAKLAMKVLGAKLQSMNMEIRRPNDYNATSDPTRTKTLEEELGVPPSDMVKQNEKEDWWQMRALFRAPVT